MIKERKILTWEELANKINQMSPEERKESVKVWGDERNLRDDVYGRQKVYERINKKDND